MQEFILNADHITLGQLLKAADIVASGGEAKAVITSGAILVNGATETRRGRKLVPGDILRIGRKTIKITAAAEASLC